MEDEGGLEPCHPEEGLLKGGEPRGREHDEDILSCDSSLLLVVLLVVMEYLLDQLVNICCAVTLLQLTLLIVVVVIITRCVTSNANELIQESLLTDKPPS